MIVISMSKETIHEQNQAIDALQLYRLFQQQRQGLSKHVSEHLHSAALDFLASMPIEARESKIQSITDNAADHWSLKQNNVNETQPNKAKNYFSWLQNPFKFTAFSENHAASLAVVTIAIIGGSLLITPPFSTRQTETIWDTVALENCHSCNELATLASTQMRGTLPNSRIPMTVQARKIGRLAASLDLLRQLPHSDYQTESIRNVINRVTILSRAPEFNELHTSLLKFSELTTYSATTVDSLVTTVDHFFQNSTQAENYRLGKGLETLYISSLSHQRDNNPAVMSNAIKNWPTLSKILKQNSNTDIQKLVTLITKIQAEDVISQQHAAEVVQRLQTVIARLTR